MHLYAYIYVTHICYAQHYLPVDARACARPHGCAPRARIRGAAAHYGPRRTDDPAERVPPAVAAPLGPERRRIQSATW